MLNGPHERVQQMTWVVGATSQSRGVLVSDVRVTFADGSRADILQKSFLIANYLAAGFAGSVRIGFDLISGLRSLIPEDGIIGRHACDPFEVATVWAPQTQEIFSAAPSQERKNGASMLIVGASPMEHLGAPQFPRMYLIRMVAPQFIPRFFNQGLPMTSIGSGSRVTEYKAALRPLFRNSSGIVKAHMTGIHGWAETLGFSITSLVRESQTSEFSESLHITGVTLGDMVQVNNNTTIYPRVGSPLVLRMPPVAGSWAEFDAMAATCNKLSGSATC